MSHTSSGYVKHSIWYVWFLYNSTIKKPKEKTEHHFETADWQKDCNKTHLATGCTFWSICRCLPACPQSFESYPNMFVLSVLKSTKTEKVSHPSSVVSLIVWQSLTIHPFAPHGRKAIHSSSLCFSMTIHPSSAGCNKTLASVHHRSWI